MLNKAILMGRLTRDPELRHTASNTPVTSFTIACDRRKDGCDFIDIVAWNNTAEFVSKYFHKGSSIIVSGRIATRKYEAKDGTNRTAVEVVADEVFFAERKNSGESAASPVSAPIPSGFEEIADSDELPF